MKFRTLLYIFLVAVILSAVFVVKNFVKKPNIEKSDKLININTDKVDFLAMQSGENNMELKKVNDVWQVAEYQADQEKIEAVLAKLVSIKTANLVGRSPSNFANFKVGDDGLKVVLRAGEEEQSIMIGKNDPGWQGTYVRQASSNNVYLTDDELNSLLPLTVDSWRDKTIISLEESQIKQIEFQYPQEKLTLARQENNFWQARDNRGQATTVPENIISDFFARLKPLKASGFLTEESVAQFKKSKPQSTIIFKGLDNQEVAVWNLVEQENAWWLKVKGRDFYYEVMKYALNDVMFKSEKIF